MIVATGSSQVALLDTRTNTVSGMAATPGRTRAVAAAPDGTRAYVASGRTVTMIDLATRTGAGSVLVPGVRSRWPSRPTGRASSPHARARSTSSIRRPRSGSAAASWPARRSIWRSRRSRAVVVQTGGKVAVLNLTTGRLVRRLKLPGAAGVSVDADGEAWVSATTPRKGKRRANSRLVRIASTNGVVTGSVDLGTDGGGGVSVGPEGTKAIVAPGANLARRYRRAALVDLARRRVIARTATGNGPGRASYASDGVRLYVSNTPPRHGLHPLRDQRQAPAHGDPVRRRRADGPARARAVDRHRSAARR